MKRARSRTQRKAGPTSITGTMKRLVHRVRCCRCRARSTTRRRRWTFSRFSTSSSRGWRSSVFPVYNSYQTPAGHLPPKKSEQLAVVSLTLLREEHVHQADIQRARASGLRGNAGGEPLASTNAKIETGLDRARG